MKINALKFGIAFGILYALTFFVVGILAALFGWGAEIMMLMENLYVGFGPTPLGAVIGAIWGFVLGFGLFGCAAWIYNRLIGRSEANLALGHSAPPTFS